MQEFFASAKRPCFEQTGSKTIPENGFG